MGLYLFWQLLQAIVQQKNRLNGRVLSINGNDAFLLADQNLDNQPYNNQPWADVTWATCALRTWLNEIFLNNAFSKDEQNAIKKTLVVNENNLEYGTNGGVDTTDKVYLLSIAEASNSAYGFDSEFYEDSETRVAMNSIGEAGFWLLRSPGRYSASVALVNSVGYGYGYGGISTDTFSVRPALHLNLSSSSFGVMLGKFLQMECGLPTPPRQIHLHQCIVSGVE